jgi:hypothetical protein
LLIFELYSTFSAEIKALRQCKSTFFDISALHFRQPELMRRTPSFERYQTTGGQRANFAGGSGGNLHSHQASSPPM